MIRYNAVLLFFLYLVLISNLNGSFQWLSSVNPGSRIFSVSTTKVVIGGIVELFYVTIFYFLYFIAYHVFMFVLDMIVCIKTWQV